MASQALEASVSSLHTFLLTKKVWRPRRAITLQVWNYFVLNAVREPIPVGSLSLIN